MKLKVIIEKVLEEFQSQTGETNLTLIHNEIYTRALDNGRDVDNNDNTSGILNDTDSELSGLSHVDAPNDVIYMVCGVVIAMLLVGLIIVLVAVTINKLRKREESSVSPATIEAQTTTFATTQQQRNNIINNNINNINNNNQPSQILTAPITDVTTNHDDNHHCNGNVTAPIAYRQSPSSVWVFPPLPPQPNIYNCSNHIDALVHGNDKHGFKGFRKQFSGRFKRLVAKKPQEPAPAIPPELKPQLKTIYVY